MAGEPVDPLGRRLESKLLLHAGASAASAYGRCDGSSTTDTHGTGTAALATHLLGGDCGFTTLLVVGLEHPAHLLLRVSSSRLSGRWSYGEARPAGGHDGIVTLALCVKVPSFGNAALFPNPQVGVSATTSQYPPAGSEGDQRVLPPTTLWSPVYEAYDGLVGLEPTSH